MKKKRYLEFLRSAALLFVIFNHLDGFMLFSRYPQTSWHFWVYLALSIACRMAVPMYFMISGAVLLNRQEEPLGMLWKKRVLPFFWKLLFVTGVYGARMILRGDFGELLRFAYTQGISYHLPFMYSYLAFLMSLPFLRKLVKQMNRQEFLYMFGIVAVLKLVPIVEALAWNGEISLISGIRPSWMLSNIVFYPCLGYFLEHCLPLAETGKLRKWLWAANVLGIGLCAVTTAVQGSRTGEYGVNYLDNLVWIHCAALFLSSKQFFYKAVLPQWVCSGILAAGSCSFGVYLFHALFLKYVPMRSVDLLGILGASEMVSCWGYVLLTAVSVGAVVFVLKKLPVLRKLL